MKKQNKLGRYEKGVIITGIAVLIIFLILLTFDGIKNIGKNKQNLALSEQEEVVPPNMPVLSAGMIPVKYEGDNLIICKNDSSWYNYEAGTPAYMMLNDGVYQSELVVDMINKKLASENIGQVVPKEEQGSIYMWIPRFEINGEDKIKYVKDVNYASDGYEIPEMFTYKQAIETSPDFLLTGIWIEKTPLANASAVTTKITNMTGENNTYGFIANTIATNVENSFSETWLPYSRELSAKQTEGSDTSVEDLPPLDKGGGTAVPEGSIADPSNTNRTTLKILNDKYQDPIKVKCEYNKTTGLIETTVTYSKYGINRITFEDTTELQMANTNGIITANTAGITLEAGTYKISITDKNGTTKKLKVKVPYVYGREVLGYECDVPNVKWRLFHADDQNIYLIADDYIPYANLPTSTNGTALNKGSTNYMASLDSIINDYIGSRWIIENTNEQAQKWLSQYLDKYPNGTDTSIKATAYMMDTDSWSTFKGDKAEYAIGGPTIELFCASYKQTHPDKYIEGDTLDRAYGYYIKWSDDSYSNGINGLIKDEYNSIYIKGTNTKASGMWIASPCTSASDLMQAEYGGYVGAYSYNNSGDGFRPIVCLKSGVGLLDNGDNTYSIKETIMANIEYKQGIIEIKVRYSENGIQEITDEYGNKLTLKEENGVITANTGDLKIAKGTYSFTITDNKGNKKELTISPNVDSLFKVAYINGIDNMNNLSTYTKTTETKTADENALINQIKAIDTTTTYSRAIRNGSQSITAIGEVIRTSQDEQLYAYEQYRANVDKTTYSWAPNAEETVTYTNDRKFGLYVSAKTDSTTGKVSLGTWSTYNSGGRYSFSSNASDPADVSDKVSGYYYWSGYNSYTNTIKRKYYQLVTKKQYSKGTFVANILGAADAYESNKEDAAGRYWYIRRTIIPKYTLYKYDQSLNLKSAYNVETKVLETTAIDISNRGNNKVKLTLSASGSNYKIYISNDKTNWQEITDITSGVAKELNVDDFDNLYIKIEENTSIITNIDVALYKD